MSGSQIVGTWRDKTIQAQIRRERSGEGTALSLPIPRAFFCITFYCTTLHYYLGDWNRRSLGLHSIPLILVSCSSRLAEAFDGPFPKIPAGCVRVVREVDLQRDKLKLRENEQQKTRNLSRNNDAKRVE